MEQPLVSVIIPAYRCADSICSSIDSALSQQVPLEVIVINDCSPDALDSVMTRYQGDPRVRHLKNDTNLGAARSRERGTTGAGRICGFSGQ